MITKYRIWNYKKKEMNNNVLSIDFHSKQVEIDDGMWTSKYWFSDVELMCSIDERDKNGKEIFEGDIVQNEYF